MHGSSRGGQGIGLQRRLVRLKVLFATLWNLCIFGAFWKTISQSLRILLEFGITTYDTFAKKRKSCVSSERSVSPKSGPFRGITSSSTSAMTYDTLTACLILASRIKIRRSTIQCCVCDCDQKWDFLAASSDHFHANIKGTEYTDVSL